MMMKAYTIVSLVIMTTAASASYLNDEQRDGVFGVVVNGVQSFDDTTLRFRAAGRARRRKGGCG